MQKARFKQLATLLAATVLVGCVIVEDEPAVTAGDGEFDSFTTSGGADNLGVAEGSAEARAILEVANSYSKHKLVRDVELYWHASHNINTYRKGADGVRGTSDDEFIGSMAELDDIRYVGPLSLKRLRTFVNEAGLVADHTIEFDKVVPDTMKTVDGAAFKGSLKQREKVAVRLDGRIGDRVQMWLRKANGTNWNPKISVTDATTGEVITTGNPWGHADARVPQDDDMVADGWEIDRDVQLVVTVENTHKKFEGDYEFVLECVGGPCFPETAGIVLDGDFANLRDGELREQMVARHELTHTFLSYFDARTHMFAEIDNNRGLVECVYTGAKIATTSIPKSHLMNAEHTWPQSLGAVDGTARTDLHHLFPVISNVNSLRANYEYCEVENVTRSMGVAMYGTDSKGNRCFEPRDSHKGNAARAMFYFAAVYQQAIPAREEAVLRAWHEADPVNSKEEERNLFVETVQGSRNPFIDQPELVDRIADF